MEKLINKDLLKIDENWLNPTKGRVLVSEPFASNVIFKRSVVYIIENSAVRTLGFIRNKPVIIKNNPLLDLIMPLPVRLSFGGPVYLDRISCIHTLGNSIIPNSQEIADGVYFGGDCNLVMKKITLGEIPQEQVRFFLGCTAWRPNQLQEEINSKYWIVGNLDKKFIVNYDSNVWAEAVNNLGGHYKLWGNLPINPMWN